MGNDLVADKYFFKTTGQEPNEECVEKCMVKNDGTFIGSVSCQSCRFCLNSDSTYNGCTWIVCEKINEAKPNITNT